MVGTMLVSLCAQASRAALQTGADCLAGLGGFREVTILGKQDGARLQESGAPAVLGSHHEGDFGKVVAGCGLHGGK